MNETTKPSCPTHIKGEAKREWTRISHELEASGLLATSDRTVLALYCNAWQRWRKAEAEIETLGEVIPAPRTKTMMGNPWLTISNKAHEQCLKLLIELGLTPKARSKMKAKEAEIEEDFNF